MTNKRRVYREMCVLSSASQQQRLAPEPSFAPAVARAPLDWQPRHKRVQTECKDDWQDDRPIREEGPLFRTEPRPHPSYKWFRGLIQYYWYELSKCSSGQ